MRIFILCLISCSLLACAEQQNQPQMPATINRGGVEISYTSCGSGDTTLLFVHGWCINKEYWEPQLSFFCPRYRVVAIDLPGFGKSGRNRQHWTFDEYTLDVKAVIDSLSLKNVILIGHSMSGDIVLNISNRYPGSVIGIVGIDNLHQPGGEPTDEERKQNAAFFDQLGKQFDSTAGQLMPGSLFQASTPVAVSERVMKDIYNSDSSIAASVLYDLSQVAAREKPVMQGLHHRLFLVNSDVYPVSADSLNKYCAKGFTAFTVPGTGHYPMLEKPAEFNKALQSAIDAVALEKK